MWCGGGVWAEHKKTLERAVVVHLNTDQLGKEPGLATVEGHLHPDDLAPAAAVGVATNGHDLGGVRCADDLVVVRVVDRRIDVELVDDVVGLVPGREAVRGGARRCAEVRGGERRCAEVRGGARK